MDLRKYVKEIWMIARNNDDASDLHIAQAMFEANLRNETETYKGGGLVNYAEVGKEWNALATGERQKASVACSHAINYWYFQLVELSKAEEWDVFEKLIFATELGTKTDADGAPAVWSKKEVTKWKRSMMKEIRYELHPELRPEPEESTDTPAES